ncbi:MAG: hypothetical protein ABUL44_00535 [Flavobacterium sp.]
MKTLLIWVAAFTLPLTVLAQEKTKDMKTLMEEAKLSCKLTTPELQQRKKTVIADLKTQVLEKTETEKGFKYKFNGSDKMLDLLNSFIKTERLCCSFFVFNLTASSDNSFAWLELSGPEGTKDFIKHEIEF